MADCFRESRGGSRRVQVVALVAILALIVSGLPQPAYAQVAGGRFTCPPPSNIYIYKQLYGQVRCWLESVGAYDAFFEFGQYLLVFLVLIQFYSGWVAGSPMAMSSALTRLILGFLLLSFVRTGFLDQVLDTTYTSFAKVGYEVLRRTPAQLGSLGNIKDNIAQFIGAIAGSGLGIWGTVIFGISSIGILLFWFMLFAVFVALYFMVQTFALLILALAQLLAPVSFAAIGYSGTARWTWRWVSGVLNALVTVLLANLAASAAMYLSGAVPTQFVMSLFPEKTSTAGALIAGAILPVLALFIIPAFGILALMKVETVVAHFTDAFGDFTATMVDIASGAIGWRALRYFTHLGGGPPRGPGGPGGPVPSGGPVASAAGMLTDQRPLMGSPGGTRMSTLPPPPPTPSVVVPPPTAAVPPPTAAAPPSPPGPLEFHPAPWIPMWGTAPIKLSAWNIASGLEFTGWDVEYTARGANVVSPNGHKVTLIQGKNEVVAYWRDTGRNEHRLLYREDGTILYQAPGSKDYLYAGMWR